MNWDEPTVAEEATRATPDEGDKGDVAKGEEIKIFLLANWLLVEAKPRNTPTAVAASSRV